MAQNVVEYMVTGMIEWDEEESTARLLALFMKYPNDSKRLLTDCTVNFFFIKICAKRIEKTTKVFAMDNE